jgi:hypothetical protein
MNFHTYLILTHLLRPHSAPHDNPLMTAYFGLVGVIIGGVLTGGINTALAFWQSKREAKKSLTQQAEKFKIAARLVQYNLRRAIQNADVFIKTQTTMELKFYHVDLRSWDAHKEVIAADVSLDLWTKLIKGTLAATIIEETIHSTATQVMSSADKVGAVGKFKVQVEIAADALSAYV